MIDRDYLDREKAAFIAAATAEHSFRAVCGHLGFDARTIAPGQSPLKAIAAWRRELARREMIAKRREQEERSGEAG